MYLSVKNTLLFSPVKNNYNNNYLLSYIASSVLTTPCDRGFHVLTLAGQVQCLDSHISVS